MVIIKIVPIISIILIFSIILTSCSVGNENITLTEQKIADFYKVNYELLNNATQEYKLVVKPNFKDAYIYIVFSDGDLNIYDSVNEVSYTNEQVDYKYCTDTLSAMNKYMLDIGFTQNNVDYTVSIFKYRLTQDFTEDGSIQETVAFEFQDIYNGIGYILLNTPEKPSNEDFFKVDENWYIHIWYQV